MVGLELYDFQLIREFIRYEDHKAFVEKANNEAQFRGKDFSDFSYIKTDEHANCVNGAWMTRKYHLIDTNGVEMASMDGSDIDSNIYKMTPKLYSLVCNE